jgi:uncharacterized protein YyaL (SSP411 family)
MRRLECCCAAIGNRTRPFRDFLDDYAFFTQGLLDLYEADFHLPYLQAAIRLTEKQSELFEDKSGGGFFSAAAGDSSLVMRIKDDDDEAEPSGNSVAACNLLRLAQMTDRKDFHDSADRLRKKMGKRRRMFVRTTPANSRLRIRKNSRNCYSRPTAPSVSAGGSF